MAGPTSSEPTGLRAFVQRWKTPGLVVGAVMVSEVGRRVGALGLNGQALSDYFRRGGIPPLLHLYDRLVGGAISRGAIFALGIMPYVSARLWIRLGRSVVPQMRAMWTHEAGRERLTRWTRRLTFCFSVAQSLGYARFVQSIPGAVTNPGIGFTIRTMVVLTAATMVAALIGERLLPYPEVEDVAPDDLHHARDDRRESGAAGETATEPEESTPPAAVGANQGGELLLESGPIESVPVYERRAEAEPVRRGRP